MRLFFAVEAPRGIQKNIQNFLEKIRPRLSFLKASWVPQENIHITTLFMGEMPQEKLSALKDCAQRGVQGFSPFEVALNGLGVFPNERNPRVLWLGLASGGDTLIKLTNQLAQTLTQKEFSFDKKEFHPHLTIARIKALIGQAAFKANWLETLNDKMEPPSKWWVRDLVLMESQLARPHSIYQAIKRFPLALPPHG